jgi:hypothetical protein
VEHLALPLALGVEVALVEGAGHLGVVLGLADQREQNLPGRVLGQEPREVREGDALDTLARDLPGQIDIVLLDGAKGLYPAVLALVEERLRPGALIVADNADRSPEYLHRVRSADGGYTSVPFAADVESRCGQADLASRPDMNGFNGRAV